MNRWATALERHMEALLRLNRKLLAVVEQRQPAMVARDVDRLERLLGEERAISTAVFEEEQRRRQTVLRLRADLGKPAP